MPELLQVDRPPARGMVLHTLCMYDPISQLHSYIVCVCVSQSTPHRVVLAKVRGYPLWPAKLISETTDKCDVRFFGQHDRSVTLLPSLPPLLTQQSQVSSSQVLYPGADWPSSNSLFKDTVLERRHVRTAQV